MAVSPRAALRHPNFIVGAFITFAINFGLNLLFQFAQLTNSFKQDRAPHMPFDEMLHVGPWHTCILLDAPLTAFIIAWINGFLGPLQPMKDVRIGKIPAVDPAALRTGFWRFFPELRRPSLCGMSFILALRFTLVWAGLELLAFAIACKAFDECNVPSLVYIWVKASWAGLEAAAVNMFVYVMASASHPGPEASASLLGDEQGEVGYGAGAGAGAGLALTTTDDSKRDGGTVAPPKPSDTEPRDDPSSWSAVALVSDARALAAAEEAAHGSLAPRLEQERAESAATQAQALRGLGPARGPRPLRIAILTVGTRGDVQPFVGLALALRRAGHHPVICTTRDFAQFVADHGIEYADGGVERIEQPDGWLTARTIGDMFFATASQFERFYQPMAEAFLAAASRPRADVIVATAMTVSFGLDLAEALRVPVWCCKLAPDIPTRAFPPPGSSASSCGLGNLWKHYLYWGRVASAAGKTRLTQLENEFRARSLALGPFAGMQRLRELGRTPTVCGFSPTLLPKPADWPATVHVSGFWLLDAQGQYQLPDDVRAFLDAGPRPVCVTFGSMVLVQRAGVLQAVLAALRHLHQRVLLITGWAEAPPGLDDSVLAVRSLPHEHIFPLCRAVVHHGGAGTTARVLHAGVPQVIIPVLRWSDQTLWGQRVAALGVGVYVKQTSVPSVVSAVARCLDPNAPIFSEARVVGARVREEEARALEETVCRIVNDDRVASEAAVDVGAVEGK